MNHLSYSRLQEIKALFDLILNVNVEYLFLYSYIGHNVIL